MNIKKFLKELEEQLGYISQILEKSARKDKLKTLRKEAFSACDDLDYWQKEIKKINKGQ